jgi:hypothetical protein
MESHHFHHQSWSFAVNLFDKRVLRYVVLGDEPEKVAEDEDIDDEQEPEWPLPANGRYSGMSVPPLRTRGTRTGTVSSKASGRTGETASDREDDDE